jgi:hypothetical protein
MTEEWGKEEDRIQKPGVRIYSPGGDNRGQKGKGTKMQSRKRPSAIRKQLHFTGQAERRKNHPTWLFVI